MSLSERLSARCGYMGASSRLYGRVLHLDFRGRTWPTSDPGLDLSEYLRGQLSREGYDLDRVVVKGVTLAPPTYSTDPGAMDLTDAEWEKQRRTIPWGADPEPQDSAR